MKIHILFMALLSLTLSNCQAQASLITITNPQKGNTGHRGIIPQDEAYKPIEGKAYYGLTLTVNKDCSLQISNLTVKTESGQYKLVPTFEDGKKKKRFKTGEIVYLRVEKENDAVAAKPTIGGEGNLAIKINGRLKRIPISTFKMVMPM